MLQSMCECAKEEMKAMVAEELGSWKNAVTTADGCWLTRGHFSQNFTSIIKNYQKNTILWYGHLCMRGSDDVVEEPLYPGTAKSAEGRLAGKLVQQAKEEGCQVLVNWQNSDSSSDKAITTVYPLVSIMYCSGHVGRALAHRLVDFKVKKASRRCTRTTTMPSIPLSIRSPAAVLTLSIGLDVAVSQKISFVVPV